MGGEGEPIHDVAFSDAPATLQHMKNDVVSYMWHMSMSQGNHFHLCLELWVKNLTGTGYFKICGPWLKENWNRSTQWMACHCKKQSVKCLKTFTR